jgi:hypothetical protein
VQRSPRRLPLLNGAEAKTYMIESRINFGENTFQDWPQLFDDPTREDYHYYNNDVDWQDMVLRNAVIQNYNLGIRGGENKIKYAVSAGYFDQEGVVINSDYKRFYGPPQPRLRPLQESAHRQQPELYPFARQAPRHRRRVQPGSLQHGPPGAAFLPDLAAGLPGR